MKKLIILTHLIFIISIIHAQNDTVFIRYNGASYDEEIQYKTDTVIFPTPVARKILHGTGILPWTKNQQIAKGYGLYLKKVAITSCDSRSRPPKTEEVVAIYKTDSTLLIELNIIGNCCHEFLCDVQVIDNKTINLIQHDYGATYCGCTCCFGLTYHFSITKTDEYAKLESIIIDGVVATRKKL